MSGGTGNTNITTLEGNTSINVVYSWLETTINIYHLINSVGQKVRSSLSGQFWCLSYGWGCSYVNVCLHLEGLLPKQVLAALLAEGLSSSPHGSLHRLFECRQKMVASFPQNKQFKQVKQKLQHIFSYLILKITHHHFPPILLITKSRPVQYRKGLHKKLNIRKKVSLWILWEAGYHRERGNNINELNSHLL